VLLRLSRFSSGFEISPGPTMVERLTTLLSRLARFLVLGAILVGAITLPARSPEESRELATAVALPSFDEKPGFEDALYETLWAEVPEPEPAPPAHVITLLPEPWAQPPTRINETPPPPVLAKAAIVVDDASGAVLFEKDAHLPLPPASLTKIATAIIALEIGDLDAWVVSDVNSRHMVGSTLMGLLPGDRFQLRDLLYGLMLPSGNDAALVIGRHLAGSDEAFVAMLNELSQRLGLKDTNFSDPHGLGGDQHLASAYDIALLARYAMSVPDFREIVSAHSWVARGSRVIQLRNMNTFLFSYPGADGIKTGYTNSAGRTIVTSATREGQRVYAVVLNSPARDADARRLTDWAFANFNWGAD
jgi:D-alanyl-D-alanine carboxypeptidase